MDNLVIKWSARHGLLDIVKMLLRADPCVVNPAASNNTAIVRACEGGFVDVVVELMSDVRVDPSANDNRAIKEAAKHGHADVVRALLTCRCGGGGLTDHCVQSPGTQGHQQHQHHHQQLQQQQQQQGTGGLATSGELVQAHSVETSADGVTPRSTCNNSGSRCRSTWVDASAGDNEAICTAAARHHGATVRTLFGGSTKVQRALFTKCDDPVRKAIRRMELPLVRQAMAAMGGRIPPDVIREIAEYALF
jgi:hypothetical protein